MAEGEVLCTVCNKQYSSARSLLLHTNRVHKKLKPFHCTSCSHACFCKEEWELHALTHTKPPAPLTPKSSTPPRSFQCVLCEGNFSKKISLDRHVKQTHSTNNSLTCDICQYGTNRKDVLRNHIICHLQKQTSLLYKCDKCYKSYTRKIYLNSHTCKNSKQIFECKTCDFKTSSRNLYLKHEKREHPVKKSEKVHKCLDCGRIFSSGCSLKNHTRRVHLKVRPHRCAQCPFAAYTPFDLKRHALSHLTAPPSEAAQGTRVHECGECGKKFYLKANLEVHLRRVHLRLRPFKCKICGFSCSRRFDLQRHSLCHRTRVSSQN